MENTKYSKCTQCNAIENIVHEVEELYEYYYCLDCGRTITINNNREETIKEGAGVVCVTKNKTGVSELYFLKEESALTEIDFFNNLFLTDKSIDTTKSYITFFDFSNNSLRCLAGNPSINNSFDGNSDSFESISQDEIPF